MLTREQILHKENIIKQDIARRIPGFEIKNKQTSTFMKVLGLFLFFVKDFNTKFTTTIYPKVYFTSIPYAPTKNEDYNLILFMTILCHERQHLLDRKKYWQLFNIMYIFPQVCSLLALLAIFYSLWWLLFLLALLPIPSIGRAWIEYRGYRTSQAVYFWLTGKEYLIEKLVSPFVYGNYYFMFPFKQFLIKKFQNSQKELNLNNLKSLPSYLQNLKTTLEI